MKRRQGDRARCCTSHVHGQTCLGLPGRGVLGASHAPHRECKSRTAAVHRACEAAQQASRCPSHLLVVVAMARVRVVSGLLLGIVLLMLLNRNKAEMGFDNC